VQAGVEIVFIDNQGNLGAPRSPAGADTEYPQLAWNGSEARLTWSNFHTTPFVGWERLDGTGQPLASPSIEFGPGNYGAAPQVALGPDSFIAMPGATSRTGAASQLELVRLDQAANVTSRTLVVKDPNDLTQYRVALNGGRVIFAWLDEGIGLAEAPSAPGRIGLASVTP
jgi:hypothetical protein